MKRIFLSLLSIAAVCAAEAQQTDSSTIYLNEQQQSSLRASDDTATLSIGGLELTFGERTPVMTLGAYPTKNESRTKISFAGINGASYNHLSLMEFGFCQLVNTDYGAYAAEDHGFLDLNNGKSIHVAFNFVTFNTVLNRSRTLGLSIGMGLSVENYTFSNDLTIKYSEGMMRPEPIDPSYKKSKLVATYLHMPVLLDWNIIKRMFISAGLNFDLNIGGHTKIKFPKEKYRNCHLNPFNVGATVRFGFQRLYVYGNYSFMEMFKQDSAPKAHRMSVGLGLWF
ncbi:MAG: PorT family protein [Alistipes sp.]|nr:PorT family protein [Alistipes sp.]